MQNAPEISTISAGQRRFAGSGSVATARPGSGTNSEPQATSPPSGRYNNSGSADPSGDVALEGPASSVTAADARFPWFASRRVSHPVVTAMQQTNIENCPKHRTPPLYPPLLSALLESGRARPRQGHWSLGNLVRQRDEAVTYRGIRSAHGSSHRARQRRARDRQGARECDVGASDRSTAHGRRHHLGQP